MRRFGIVLSFLILISFTAKADGIDFYDGEWSDAIAEALESEKLVFVDAYATWCGPCKRMAKNEFTKKDVGDFFNENFINIKLNMETPSGQKFGQQYAVSAYPTMFFIDGNGEVVKKMKGYRDGNALIDAGMLALTSVDYSDKYAVKYEAGERDFDLVYEYLRSLNKAGKPTLKITNEYLREYDQLSEDQKLQIIAVGANEADSKLFETVIAKQEKLRKLLGEDLFYNLTDKACKNTVDKAIKFEYPELLEDAVGKMKSLKSPNTKAFSYQAPMQYALAYKDVNGYLSKAKPYTKKFAKKDSEILQTVSAEIFQNFDTNGDALAFAYECCDKLIKQDPSEKNYKHYVSVLLMKDQKEKALELAKQGLKELDKQGKKSSYLEKMIKYIES